MSSQAQSAGCAERRKRRREESSTCLLMGVAIIVQGGRSLSVTNVVDDHRPAAYYVGDGWDWKHGLV